MCGSLPSSAQSTFTVDRITDIGEGEGLRGDLRYCLTQAMSGDRITFEVTGTINLTRTLPELTQSVTIEGPGRDRLSIRRDSGRNYRIFTVTGTPIIAIAGLTIANGQAALGGGMYVAGGTLTLADITLSDNQAAGPDGLEGEGQAGLGGGIYVAGGRVTIVESILSGNRATGGRGGNFFPFSLNGAFGGRGTGGGIYVAGGTVAVHRSTFFGNQSRGGRGGDGFSLPDIRGGNGGAGGPGDGGGIYVAEGTVSVSDTTLSNNQATGGDGGNGGSSTFDDGGTGGDGAPGDGGGIHVAGGAIEVFQNTLSANQSLGGNGGYGGDGGHFPGVPGNGSDGLGGGLSIFAGTVGLQHSTVSTNQATGGDSPGGRATQGAGGGILVRVNVRLQTRNTILAGNIAQTNAPDFSGNLGSLGHNLIGNSAGGSGFDPSDLQDVDPRLGPLQDNGGPTPTHALLEGSPAIGAGDMTDAPEFDQRGPGFPRIVNGMIDIGAFEVQ